MRIVIENVENSKPCFIHLARLLLRHPCNYFFRHQLQHSIVVPRFRMVLIKSLEELKDTLKTNYNGKSEIFISVRVTVRNDI